ncbi:hypothetical protein M758_3G118900 [Ceratodon purpureus]|nr:hypothetical protein M758_3G118900 [Ceratodon purpureus]
MSTLVGLAYLWIMVDLSPTWNWRQLRLFKTEEFPAFNVAFIRDFAAYYRVWECLYTKQLHLELQECFPEITASVTVPRDPVWKCCLVEE